MLQWKETQSGDLHRLSPTLERIMIKWIHSIDLGFPGGSAVKISPAIQEMRVWSSGEGNGNPLQYSCLGNPMDRGAWGGYSPWGCKNVRHDSATKQQQHWFILILRKDKMATGVKWEVENIVSHYLPLIKCWAQPISCPQYLNIESNQLYSISTKV